MKYICHYDIDNREKRNYFLSAKNKIDYIIDCLSSLSLDSIQIISPARTKGVVYCPQRLVSLSDKVSLKLFRSFGRKNIITKTLDHFLFPIYLFIYLLKHTKKDEPVFVYHSLALINTVKFAKLIKKFRLILEFEEIYSDVTGKKTQRKKELNFTKYADGFILATSLLQEALNINKKPVVICNGTYQVEKQRNLTYREAGERENKVIHCVYAGTFDPRKGGCVAAAAAAEFLPANYHIHVIGFGSDKEIENIKNFISEIAKKANSTVTFDGLKSGEEYIQFIQSCDIGLSTQDPKAAFNATSFPSKILSYMSNGLRVVSIRIPAIEQSEVGSCLYYYDKQMPEEIAKAILSVDLSDKYDGRALIKNLDLNFRSELQNLLNNVYPNT